MPPRITNYLDMVPGIDDSLNLGADDPLRFKKLFLSDRITDNTLTNYLSFSSTRVTLSGADLFLQGTDSDTAPSPIYLVSGSSTSPNDQNIDGAEISLESGGATGNGSGGIIQLVSGDGGLLGTGGEINLTTGDGGINGGNGGSINLTGGNGIHDGAFGGDITLRPGAGDPAAELNNGYVNITDPVTDYSASLDTSAISGSDKIFYFPNESGFFVLNAFKTIAVSGQSNVVADTDTDTLTLAAGSGMSITTSASTDTITFTSTITQYTNENAQDAVGGILTDSSRIDFTYNDGANTITADIIADSVSNTYLANMAQSTIKGRAAGAGTGDPTDLTATQATAILDNVVGDSGSGGTKGLVPAPAAGDAAAGKFLKADGTWTAPSGGGITRSINSISSSTTAGSTALTDYVYFVTGTTTLTLPTAVGNTNRYTIKSISGATTVDGAGVETIDGSASIDIANEDSVDLISNNVEWKVV